MKSAALVLVAILLLFVSPALALEPATVVDEDPAVTTPKRLATLVEEESVAPVSKTPLRLVQEESDAPAQPETEPEAPQEQPPEQQAPEADQQAPEQQAPEAEQQPPEQEPPPQEEQPEEQQQAPEPPPPPPPPPAQPLPEAPAPMPPASEMPMLHQSTPGTRQAATTTVRIVASAPVQDAPAAPTQPASTIVDEEAPVAPTRQGSTTVAEEQSATPTPEQNSQPSGPTYFSEIASDFRYTVNNAEADAEDVLTAPLHIGDAGSLFSEPKFYYTVLGAGAALGGAFALDQTVRAHLRHMGSSTADDFETGGNAFTYGSSALLYLWGLQSADSNLREHEITGFEASGIASLITIGFKDGFGRLRPRQGHGHFAFFDQGESFVSGAATPVYALAAATSEAYDNAWYAAIPAYLGASAVGIGRMGNDAHWVSDIVGAALVGVGTTELMLYMHRQHALDTSRFRIFPVSAPASTLPAAHQNVSQGLGPQGLGVSYEW
ncbi:MAG: phosphatase PAP2 family protein [Candidatus Binataceae bacterium]|jgi:chemotaxis protein histidine kinase CheA